MNDGNDSPPPERDPAPVSPGVLTTAAGWIVGVAQGINGTLLNLSKAVPPVLAALVLVTIVGFIVLASKDLLDSSTVRFIVLVVALVTIVYLGYYQKGVTQDKREAADKLQAKERRLEAAESAADIKSALERVATADGVPAKAGRQVWSRIAIKREELLSRAGDVADIKQRLVDLQAIAFTCISKESSLGPRTDQIRANVMLPDTRRAAYGQFCVLSIPESLYVNMGDGPDRAIEFGLTQGLVGKVFSESKAGGAIKEGEAWKRIFFYDEAEPQFGRPDFELTEWQKQQIHPDLRWVLSLPLPFPDGTGQSRAIGVLNIDGIGFDLDRNRLSRLFMSVGEKVAVIASQLGKLSKERIVVIAEGIS